MVYAAQLGALAVEDALAVDGAPHLGDGILVGDDDGAGKLMDDYELDTKS